MNYLTALLQHWARTDAPVITSDRGALSGANAAAIATQTIELLRERGVQPGDRVAVTGADVLETLPVSVGLALHGAIAVGLALYDAVPSRRRIVEQTSPTLLIVDRASRRTADEVADACAGVTVVEFESFTDPAAVADADSLVPLAERVAAHDAISLRYTSGSTGEPKGIVMTRAQFDRLGESLLAPLATTTAGATAGGTSDGAAVSAPPTIAPGEFLCTSPLTSVLGLIFAITFNIAGQGLRLYGGRPSPAGMLAELERTRCGYVFLPPSQMIAMMREPAFAFTDLDALHAVLYAGQPVTPSDLLEAIDEFDGRLVQYYGQSEAGLIAALSHADHATRDPELLTSAGVLFAPHEVEIRDSDGSVVAEGVSGEIHFDGASGCAGIWNADGRITSALVDGWLATGDLGRVVAGRLWITGRVRDMILYRGYNVPARSVEDVLTAHDDVREAVVHAVADGVTGEAVFAWIVPQPGCEVDAEQLRQRVRDELGEWFAPGHVERIDEVPRLTGLEKPDKVRLRELAEQLLAQRAAAREPDPAGAPA